MVDRKATRRDRFAYLLAGSTIVALAAGAAPQGASARTEPARSSDTRVVVQAQDGQVDRAEASLRALGGTVDRDLPIINGFAGHLAADRVALLNGATGVKAVTPDQKVTPMSVDPNLGYDPASTTTMSTITQITGAQAMWNKGYTGKGVDVALIDTGVARVPGLNGTNKVLDGPDLSFDSHAAGVVSVDAFGHGTHMAGIIAGSDLAAGASATGCTTCLGTSAYTNTTKFEGIAPEARIVNVKVGAYDGATDVSQVIAGIDWVVQHRADPGLNIKVLNLSFGTDSTQSYDVDPLAAAVSKAWTSGILVVAAAGNDGLATTSLADPAYSPDILAVGASNPRGTKANTDDSVPVFSQRGTSNRPIDLLAPAVSVVSLRVPGSFVDQNVTTGKVGTRFQQGSGTSQAAAVVSGLGALMYSKFPTASPDAIKKYMMSMSYLVKLVDNPDGTVSSSNVSSSYAPGAGSADISYATTTKTLTANSRSTVASSNSLTAGTLEGSRGTFHVQTASGVALTGERDVMGNPWNNANMTSQTQSATTWNGGTWNGARWSGDTWSGARWSCDSWTNNDWSGARWSDAIWQNGTWDGARWSGASWSGARWSAGTWSGARWSGARWSDAGWG